MRNHFSNSVHVDGVLFGFDNAMLTAIDVETGRRLWRERGFGKGSLVRVGRDIVVLSEEGELVLLEPARDRARVAKRQQVLDGRSWTPPSVADGRVYVRGLSELACLAPEGYGLRPFSGPGSGSCRRRPVSGLRRSGSRAAGSRGTVASQLEGAFIG
jgi:outer membrane protein assembly factor BamB